MCIRDRLKVPTLAIVIGEGGSGGAIALGSSSKVIMFENAIYSVISPEGCATILWRDPKKMLDAARAMKLSAKDLLDLKVIDEIIPEPLGGAHRDQTAAISSLGAVCFEQLHSMHSMDSAALIADRSDKYLAMGDKALA